MVYALLRLINCFKKNNNQQITGDYISLLFNE